MDVGRTAFTAGSMPTATRRAWLRLPPYKDLPLAYTGVSMRSGPQSSPSRASLPLLLLFACGPSATLNDPECALEDIQVEAALAVGLDGPSCDPCSASAGLWIATTLTTDCGPVEWHVLTTCFVSRVVTTTTSDGQVRALEGRLCGDGSSIWSVSPDDPLIVHDPPLSEVFGDAPIPASDYTFEVEYQAGPDLEPATFDVRLE